MTEILVDTSAWYDALAGRVPIPPAIVGRRRLAASTLVLGELTSLVAQGRLTEGAVALFLESARMAAPSIEDLADGGQLHGRLRRARETKVSLIDCIMYRTARRMGVPFLTRDTDLAREPGVVVY